MHVWPGRPYPLGASWDGTGVNFAVFSENATRIELCLFDSPADTRGTRIELPERTDLVFHAYLPDLLPGQLYAFRAHGPFDPAKGQRFNPNKLLLDPHARAIGRDITWDDALYGYTIGHPDADLSFDERDSAPFAPLGVVVDPSFPWGDDRRPSLPWHEMLIYELHVKGFTRKLPGVPDHLRGTYAGVGSEAAISHLRALGVTAVEFLPVHYRLNDRHLLERGLSNYWGYNTLGYFAPDPRFATAPDRAVKEFQAMVRSLHAAGIEVILDVVYNHTAEGNQLGPTLSFRGLDNPTYYFLSPEDPRYYMDFTGCGNSPRMSHPRALQLITDSLRYWVTEMHVDGFRFDLATTLARESLEADMVGGFFRVVQQDPVLSRVKLIAEPWDVGPEGYKVGEFPHGWAEWNGEYRDTVRDFWAGSEVTARRLAHRLCGSPDLYDRTGRRPHASVNFITAHDGFTLADLVSYQEKHNEANGEENRDGHNHNRSWNCGAEGPTDDPAVNQLRERQRRNLLTTLFLSQGVPMLLAGDELGQTQRGNNNCYCQDNDLTWLEWGAEDPSPNPLPQGERGLSGHAPSPSLAPSPTPPPGGEGLTPPLPPGEGAGGRGLSLPPPSPPGKGVGGLGLRAEGLGPSRAAFLRFVESLTRFWRSQPILHRRNFFQGRPIRGAGVSDVTWFTPGGEELKDEDWEKPVKVLGVRFAGDLIQEKDERGRPITGDTLFAIFNGGSGPVEFVLPSTDPRHEWERVIDTTTDHPRPDVFPGGHRHFTDARSVAVFRTRAQSVS